MSLKILNQNKIKMQRNHDKLTYQSVVINMYTMIIHYGNQMESPESENGTRYVQTVRS